MRASDTSQRSLTPAARMEDDLSGEAITVECPDLAATAALGRRLAALLPSGVVVALVGPMGAGKTHFVRAIVEGLGGDGRRVSSPTFALIHEYVARLPVYHFDTYRLPSEAAFADLGVQEYFDAGGVCLIEWADRVTGVLPDEYLRITIEPTGETSRRFEFEAVGPRYTSIVAGLSQPGP
ncbi:MAG: tRNA (adenosine(37)-N6)-threonylcarbamoyltransferase complex ATPase subunit type 1 TsaE [Gemmataceae bacterium]